MEQENQWGGAEFCAWVTTYHTQKSADVAGEYVLPDYYGDIRRVLCLRTKVHTDGSYQNANRLEYEGVVQFSLLYIAEDDRVQNATFTIDYQDSIPWDASEELEQVLMLNPSVLQSSCRVQSARKISLKAKISTEILQRTKQCVAPRIIGSNTVADEENLAYRKSECQTMDFRFASVADLPFVYELECDASVAPIGELCFSELELRFEDAVLNEEGLLCTGNAFLQCLYRTQGSEEQPQFENLCKSFPISITVADPEFGEGFLYRATPSVRTMRAECRENAYGEMRVIECHASYDLQIEAAQNQTVQVVKDAYSTACQTELQRLSMATPVLVGVYHSNVTVNEGRARSELGAEGAQRVTMLTADPKILKSNYDPDAQKLLLDGEIQIGALLSNGEGAAFSDASYRLPFHAELNHIRTTGDAEFRYDCRVLSAKGRLDEKSLFANVELGIDVMVSAVSQEELLESIELQSDARYEKDSALTVYYPMGSEELWEIAKRYHVKKEEILSQNHLPPDTQTVDFPLFIPQ